MDSKETVCVKRGGESLINAKHVKKDRCPSGTQACSASTTGIKTVCMEPQKPNKCPITDIKLLNETSVYNNYT